LFVRPDDVPGHASLKEFHEEHFHAQGTYFRQDGPAGRADFRDRGVEVDVITGKTPEELKAMIGDYDGLAIRSSTKVTKEILEAATNLKVIGRAGIGVDNVDIPGHLRRALWS
jgi:phosphoglycerate dehydrogenase-like enzyme